MGALLGKAECLKNLEKKICQGEFPTKEEIEGVPAVTGAMIFGYSETDRIASKYQKRSRTPVYISLDLTQILLVYS